MNLRKWNGAKKQPVFGKKRGHKPGEEERFETVEIKNYDQSQTNNNGNKIEHSIIVQTRKILRTKSVRNNFFPHGQGTPKANQRKK